MNHILPRAIATAVSLIVSGCGLPPLTSIYKLSKLNPETVNLMQLRAAVRVPDALRPRNVRLILEARTRNGGSARKETFILDLISNAPGQAEIKGERVAGARHYIFRIAVADLARAESFRSDIRTYRAAGGSRKGGLMSIDADACQARVLPNGKLPLTTYLKFDSKYGYVPIARNVDLRSFVDEKLLREKIPPCSD